VHYTPILYHVYYIDTFAHQSPFITVHAVWSSFCNGLTLPQLGSNGQNQEPYPRSRPSGPRASVLRAWFPPSSQQILKTSLNAAVINTQELLIKTLKHFKQYSTLGNLKVKHDYRYFFTKQ